ncbi:hypothetical protein JCM10212_007112 [Sporobolomyces blumeae]
MTSLSDAIAVKPAYTRTGVRDPLLNRYPPTTVYDAEISKFWTIGSVAQGGYLLSILTRAATTHQQLAGSAHVDPAHLTSQFLSASIVGRAQVEVRVVSTSKRWTRLDAELWQYDHPSPDTTDFVHAHRTLRITAHFLFAKLENVFDLANTSPTAPVPTFLDRTCPILQHPGQVDMANGGTWIPDKFGFKDGMRWKEVEYEQEGQEIKWAGWFEVTQGEDLTQCADLIPFFADASKNGPEILGQGKRKAVSWYPTMTLSLDFKTSFPLPRSSPSSRTTFGLFASVKSIQAGRHDLTVEVWTAPCDLGDSAKSVSKDWRSEARLVGVSTQMALTTTMAFNQSRDTRGSGSSSDGSSSDEGGKKARL